MNITKENIHLFLTKNNKLDSNKIRNLQGSIPSDYKWCDTTSELKYCYENNITSKPCCHCGNKLKYNKGTKSYSKSCSLKCTHNRPFEKQPLTKKNYQKWIASNNKLRSSAHLHLTISKDYSWCNSLGESLYCIRNNISSKPICGFTHCNKEVNFSGRYYHNACGARCQGLKQGRAQNMNKKDFDAWQRDFMMYTNKVRSLTEKQPVHLLPNFEKRGKYKTDYHLDHKYSISEGFKNNILPGIIADISNLEMLPARDNIKKGAVCSSLL